MENQRDNIDSETRVALREWTAKDISTIYTRFRPHLERHAWKFLKNQSLVDEVVQDAFLYLLVTLPELDSELGVLRFLKWKTRLLCLDVLRANGRAEISSIDSHSEFESNYPEVSANLERIDDAAVVRLALSKLSARHREVLISAMYEEKSSAEIATQLGLSENATNQLIYRARAAFKTALLGSDLDTSGMSVARILSVAARKAAKEVKKVGVQAMVAAIFLALSIGAVMNFNLLSPQIQNQGASLSDHPGKIPDELIVSADTQQPTGIEGNGDQASNLESVQSLTSPNNDDVSISNAPWEPWEIEEIYVSKDSEVSLISSAQVLNNPDLRHRLSVASDKGIVADLQFDSDALSPITDLVLTLVIAGQQYSAIPNQLDFLVFTDDGGLDHYIYLGYFSYVMDEEGEKFELGHIVWSELRLEIIVDSTMGEIVNSTLQITGG